MRKIYFLLFLCVSGFITSAQQLLSEPFNYTPDATLGLFTQSSGVWQRINSGDSVLVASGSLSYTGLATSTGNKVQFDGGGADYYTTFTSQTSGSVYQSFILNVTSLGGMNTTGTYFSSFIANGSTSIYGAAIWTRLSPTPNKYNIGISTRSNSTVSWLATDLDSATSYFIVAAYDFNASTADDVSRIWVNTTAIGGSEPTADATSAPGTDMASIDKVLIRQNNNTTTPFIEMDEIRVGTTWQSVTPSATIPVPTTTSISPSSANAGGSGFTLTVTGTNFISGQSTVTWNGSARTTSFVSSTELTATINAADIATAGTALVGVTTTGAASPSNTQTFTINAPATPLLTVNTASVGFGDVCINTTSAADSFLVSGANLTSADITIASLTGYSYSTSLNGSYTSSLNITQPGGSFSQQVYVKFSPLAVQAYNGDIVVGGGGATSVNIAATGAGVNTAPSVTTGSSTSVTTNSATISGTITANGCSPVSSYGFEYSTTNNFPNGSGTVATSTNLTGGNFSADLTSLSPNTTYYYKAFATNTGGTTYGAQQSFTTLQVGAPSAPVATSATNITSSGFTANWNAVTGATGYYLDVYTLTTGAIVDTVAGWNFLTNTSASQTADEGNVNNVDIQTISGVGLNTISWPGGPTGLTGTNPYSVSANGWDNGANTKYWEISVNTTGANNITVSSLQGSSNTGPKDFKIQYKVGASGTWTDVTGGVVTMSVAVSPGNIATWSGVTDLALPTDASNQPLVYIRWITTSTTSVNLGTVSATGTSRISAIYVKGSTGSGTVPVYVSGYQNLSVGNVTSYNVTGLSQNTTYYYVVRAENSGGTSPNSNEITVTTTAGPAPSVTAGTVNDFGNVTVGTSSTSQSFNISGANLTGAPGNITVTAPADFEVSNDNSVWGNTTTIAYTSATLASTPVYVRFSPQSSGVKTGNISITGGGLASPVLVAVSGTGVAVTAPGAPVATSATNITSSGFTANWNAVTGATGYYLDVYTLTTGAIVDTVAGWNFLTNTSASQTADEGNVNNVGIQTISGVGLNTISWPGGPTGLTGTNPYSVSANGWDNGANTKYWEISVNTTGANNITVSSLQGSSNTGPKDFKIQYKVGASGTWTDVTGGVVTMSVAVSPGNIATWSGVTDLALPTDASNQPLVYIRWITTSTTSVNLGTVSATGTSRISAIYVKGSTGSGTVPVYVSGYQNLSVGNVTSYNVTGLSQNTTYYYVVRAENSGGTSPNSNEITVTTLPDTNPAFSLTTLPAFGNVCVNTTAGPNSFTINGTNLSSADITVGPLAGYTFSTTSGGTYTPTLTLTQPGGSYTQTVYVQFSPTAVQSYDGNIPVSGGGVANTSNISVTGSGVNSLPIVITGGTSSLTNVAATAAGSITSNGCSAVTAYGIEYSTINGFANGSGTQVPSTNLSGNNFSANLSGLTPNTIYYYKAYATNGGGTAYGSQQSFTTLAAPPVVLTATTPAGFGDVCINTSAGPNSFTITGTNLTTANVTVGPLAGYSFSTTSGGTYTSTLSLSQPGGNYSQEIFVKFNPALAQSYNGNIPVGGGGAINFNVPVTGAGVVTPPTVITGSSTAITTSSATLAGSVVNSGCSSLTAYGIEISGIDGFTPGTGMQLTGNNISGSAFSVHFDSLVQGATYYYRAFAKNAGATGYGDQMSFTVKSIPNNFTVYPVPVMSGGQLYFSMKNLVPGYHGIQIFNNLGQEVYKMHFNVQGSFINDMIRVPTSLPIGTYTVRIVNNTDVLDEKTILIVR